jgi:predicted component of type VI protein secretion system
LIVAAGKNQGMTVPLRVCHFLIGREAGCHLRPASQAVAGVHCLLTTRGKNLFLRDLGSEGNTWINAAALVGEKQLADGDQIRVGPLEFMVRAPVWATADSSPSADGPKPAAAISDDMDAIAARLLTEIESEPLPEPEVRSTSDTITDLLNATPGEVPALSRKSDVHKVPSADAAASAKVILENYRQRKSRMRTNRPG